MTKKHELMTEYMYYAFLAKKYRTSIPDVARQYDFDNEKREKEIKKLENM